MDISERRKILAGGKLRKLRTNLSLSQSAMAAELGVSVSYLNLIERNQRPVTAQLLIKLSETYDVDPSTFAQDDEQRATSACEEIFADTLFQGTTVPRAEIRTLINDLPTITEAMQRLYDAYIQLRDSGMTVVGQNSDTDRGDAAMARNNHNPVETLREFLQRCNNHFPELEELAERLVAEMRVGNESIFAAVTARLHNTHNIRIQVLPVDVMGNMLKRYDTHRRKLMFSELLEASGRAFQAAFHLALVEAGPMLDQLAETASDHGPTRKLARIMLANYLAGAIMMPYQTFFTASEQLAYDVDILAARFSASYEQVAHRLTTLARPSARGVPFFMVRIDDAGNVSKRFSSGTFPFARYGGTCPRWKIHSCFRNPGRTETQALELPDGGKWFSIARTVQRAATVWGEQGAQFAIGLGCELKYAHRLVYGRDRDAKNPDATPIGVNCRLCERPNCAQRAAPPSLRPLDINENVRGPSPFDADLKA
jgi:XRE family transcriptional regulator, fatty acid utilization regulator